MRDHAVITRLHYSPTDRTWEHRVALFRTLMLPCVEAQNDQNFTYYVICDPDHVEQVSNLSPIIEAIPFPIFPKAIRESISYNDLIPPHTLQSNLDYDDLISPNYIRLLHRNVKLCIEATILTFIPTKLSLLHMRCYKLKETYSGRKASTFYSLYVPTLSAFESIYNFNHFHIPRKYEVKFLPKGYCNLVVHRYNWSTRLNTIERLSRCR